MQNYFFSQLLSSGTILTITLEMPEALVPLQTMSWDLSGQPPIMILIVKIIEESNLLQDCVLALVICVNTNSRYFKSYLQLRFWCWIDFSFYSPLSHDEKHTLLSIIKNTDCRLLDLIGTVLINTLLFGNCFVDTHTNTQILNATTEYILTTKIFDESLFYSRDLKVDGCQSNLYVMLKQLLFFYKFYNFFGRGHSLIKQPCYNNIFQFIQHESRVNTFWYCFPVIRRYTFHYLMKWALILGNQSSFEILQLSAIWRYQSLVTLFFSSVVILI